MTAAALGLGAAVLWAFADLLNLRVVRGSGQLPATFWVLLIGCGPAVVLSLAVDGTPSTHQLGSVGWATLAGVVDAAGVGLMMRALATGSLAIVAPLTSLEGGFAALGSIALGESSVTPLLAAGLLLGVAGGTLSAAGPGGRTAAGAVPALLGALAFAVVLLLLARSTGLGALTTVTIARVASTICVAPVALGRRARRPPLRLLQIGAVAGTLDVVAFAIYTHGARIGPLPVAAVAAGQFATFAAILGYFVLDERPIGRQVAGIAVTIAAVSVLATT